MMNHNLLFNNVIAISKINTLIILINIKIRIYNLSQHDWKICMENQIRQDTSNAIRLVVHIIIEIFVLTMCVGGWAFFLNNHDSSLK
jgi:hypothetical protein